jgi:hypothetical protein
MKTGWFVRGDIDGFFCLFVDNLPQLMLIAVPCTRVCGMPTELVYRWILPGAALSILFGNLFYTRPSAPAYLIAALLLLALHCYNRGEPQRTAIVA